MDENTICCLKCREENPEIARYCMYCGRCLKPTERTGWPGIIGLEVAADADVQPLIDVLWKAQTHFYPTTPKGKVEAVKWALSAKCTPRQRQALILVHHLDNLWHTWPEIEEVTGVSQAAVKSTAKIGHRNLGGLETFRILCGDKPISK